MAPAAGAGLIVACLAHPPHPRRPKCAAQPRQTADGDCRQLSRWAAAAEQTWQSTMQEGLLNCAHAVQGALTEPWHSTACSTATPLYVGSFGSGDMALVRTLLCAHHRAAGPANRLDHHFIPEGSLAPAQAAPRPRAWTQCR